MLRLQYIFSFFDASDSTVIVCSDSFSMRPYFRSNDPSSLDPRDLSLTRTVEFRTSWMSTELNSRLLSCSEMSQELRTTFDFTVFGSLPSCFPNSDLPSLFLLMRSAYKNSDKPDWSFVNIICLFARRRSLIVLISPSISPFPLWSPIGQVTCSMQKRGTKFFKRFTHEYCA